MSVKVIEFELNDPFPTFRDLDIKHYTHLQILVRKNRKPIGYVWVYARNKRFVQEDFIRFEIERQIFDNLNRAEYDQMLGGGKELTSLDAVDSYLPNVTVAVCSRNRPLSLDRTLRSMVRLDYPKDRLHMVVIDNAPIGNATERVVAKFPQVHYVVEYRPGLNWARNRAMQESRSEIVAYTDDDVEVDSFWVRALSRHFVNPAVMCVTGLVAPAERETRAQNLFEEYGGFGRGFELHYYTMGVQEYWRLWPLGAGIFGTGCNMAYRKNLFDKIGRFDEALDVGTTTRGAGDLDMFYRTLRAGFILVYEPKALVWHHHRREFAELHRQLRDFGRGVYAFLTKTFLIDRKMRWRTLWFAIIWYLQWFVGRLVRKKILPRKLVLAEAIGALQGPACYFAARFKARRIARQYQKQVHKRKTPADILIYNHQSEVKPTR